MINLNETLSKIKEVGAHNVRVVPMKGEHALDGSCALEVRRGQVWTPIAEGMTRRIAEDLINQAVNRVICG